MIYHIKENSPNPYKCVFIPMEQKADKQNVPLSASLYPRLFIYTVHQFYGYPYNLFPSLYYPVMHLSWNYWYHKCQSTERKIEAIIIF